MDGSHIYNFNIIANCDGFEVQGGTVKSANPLWTDP